MTALDRFPPLQGAIAQAESWTRYLAARPNHESLTAAAENIVWAGVHLGESLPLIWRLTFDNLFRPGNNSWTSVKEFETIRQEVRRLFFTTREAMVGFHRLATDLAAMTGRIPAGMYRLNEAIEAARQLEENVFRDWPSFAEPLPTAADSLPVDESLAEALGITLEEARQKLDARRRELSAKQE